MVLPAWTGVVLAVLGLLVFVVSYVLLPLFYPYCYGPCTRYDSGALWQFALAAVSKLQDDVQSLPDPEFVFSLLNDAIFYGIFLVLSVLALLAAVTVVGCSVGWLVRPHPAFTVWGHRAWRTGSIALVLMLLCILLLIVLSVGGLPLLAAVTVVGCFVGSLVPPHRERAVWGHRAWRTGSIALVLMLLCILLVAVLFRSGPYLGFFGLLAGYGLLWAGSRVFPTARP
jgi:hypothetical protein